MRTYLKRVRQALEQQSIDAARVALKAAVPVIARCGQKRVIPPQRAARVVSRLTNALARLENTATT